MKKCNICTAYLIFSQLFEIGTICLISRFLCSDIRCLSDRIMSFFTQGIYLLPLRVIIN